MGTGVAGFLKPCGGGVALRGVSAGTRLGLAGGATMGRAAALAMGVAVVAAGLVWQLARGAEGPTTMPDGSTHVPLVFEGGHETERVDGGRPVKLIAAALKVPDAVFRETFTHVHPARGGGGPTDAEARANKQALMEGLGKYGVTNERLDEVSNYYRYRPQNGELWTHADAKGYAVVKGGKVTGFVVTAGGAGYSSPPVVSVPGLEGVKATAVVAYGEALKTNGSVKEVKVEGAATQK